MKTESTLFKSVKPYPEDIMKLNSLVGFYEQWIIFRRTAKTDKAAYNDTEKVYRRYFGKNRFASYDSFRVMLSRKIIIP